MPKYNYKVGDFEGEATRKRPNADRLKKWGEEVLKDPLLDDYDVYLWGSFPEKKDTWDVDILLKHANASMDTEEMKEISLLSIDSSLIKNDFLVDLGFHATEEINFFDESFDKYLRTGEKTKNSGYVYGKEWTVDDKKFKDRSKWIQGDIEYLKDDIVKLSSSHPYPKQLASRNGNKLNNYYAGKPFKIKDRKRNY